MTDDDRMGGRLREIRKSLGMTQQKLADASGVSRPRIAAIECGKTPLGRIADVVKLAPALGLTAPGLLALLTDTPVSPPATGNSNGHLVGELIEEAERQIDQAARDAGWAAAGVGLARRGDVRSASVTLQHGDEQVTLHTWLPRSYADALDALVRAARKVVRES